MGDMHIEQLWATAVAALGNVSIEEIWSAALGATALLSTHLAGERRRSAWVVGMISQAGWLGFMFLVHNFGFLVSFIGFTFVYIRNHRKWSQPAAEQTGPAATPDTTTGAAAVALLGEPQPGALAPRPPCRCHQLTTSAA